MPQLELIDVNKSCVIKMPPYLFSYIAEDKIQVEGYFMMSRPLH
jgi:hypothetical protein